MRLPSAVAPNMLRQVLTQVVCAAQNGDLPLFAWTLGLPYPERLDVARFCLPHLDVMPTLPPPHYALLLKQTPPLFAPLVRHLQAQCNACADARQTLWLMHALAAACWGHRHLWQDLGLRGWGDVQQLLAHYLPRLLPHNGHPVPCKCLLFQSLGLALEQPTLQAPGCQDCDTHACRLPPRATGHALEHRV